MLLTVHLSFLWHLLLTSVLFALLEIQIEGGYGWAAKLPTWKVENKWTRIFLSARPLTGYHFFFMLFMLSVVHIPYALGFGRPDLAREMRIFAYLILFFVIEDFFWFVLNPKFRLRKFKREHIWWHVPWWGVMPRDYWLAVPLGVGLYALSWAA